MNQNAYDRIQEAVKLFAEHAKLTEFALGEGEAAKPAYKNEQKAFTVEYDEQKQQFLLLCASVTDGEASDGWNPVSAWMFDDKSSESDAVSIGNDFADTMREQLNMKAATRAMSATGPAKARAGEDITIEGLTQKLLAVYPFLKEEYAKSVEQYGEFLYADFFTRYVAPAVRETLIKNDRKKCSKLFDMFDDVYCDGVQETRAALTFLILAGAVDGDEKLRETADHYCEEHEFLKLVMGQVYREYAKAKKKQK